MKQVGSLFIASLFLFLIGCNKNDDSQNTPSDDIVGVWKLMEKIENDRLVPLGICELKEMYVFGNKQYSHETFRQDIGKYKGYQTNSTVKKTSQKVLFGSDDDYYTPIDNTVTCKSDGVSIGTWTKLDKDNYQLKGTNTIGTQLYPITFSVDKTKFYLEKTSYFGGRNTKSIYVYKKQ
ncbi:MAG: hypothetical protein LBI72_02345 [Flavobacteriaceae bacterium]|jgi:hypothetical protein|nr:hypothetical protein [Flavobacteriaceae bacterium]